MKTLLSTIIGGFILFTFATAFSATRAYTFTDADIPVPNQPGKFTFPEDINDAGSLVANVFGSEPSALLADPVTVRRAKGYKTTLIDCGNTTAAETSAFSINRLGQVVGYCANLPSNPTHLYGFIRNRNGKQTMLDFPGADGTVAWGINDLGHVVGQFYGPLRDDIGAMAYRFHCFVYKNGKYTQIDFPVANTYVDCTGINNKGQVLGEYITVTTRNDYLEHGWFIYDNGKFITDFPQSLDYLGGPVLRLVDMNNDGEIIGQRSNTGTDWDGIVLWEDGIFYPIELPPEYVSADVRGMNNRGQFVGIYIKIAGPDPVHVGEYRYEAHGYIATPVR